ncbi:GNAT family N-acetyltransferase [Alcanivorax sp. 24]|uniref:GNAT family N-acetyltransferase n=1 Tax=Alcanivorax sp. 24 TaxID=2545266 RepID=UPI00105DD6B5|nr:N-acetyltransferase [Alcanivorax sp. 24]
MTIQFRHETPSDIATIEAVTIAAFANAAHTSHTEQFIVRALRVASELTLSIVAEDQGQIVGHVALSPVTITDDHGRQVKGWYGLGPISVLPQRQGEGIGSHLMEQALFELRAMQATGCVLLGDPAYYARFGFQAHEGLQLPGAPPGYFMALALNGPVPEGNGVLTLLLVFNTGRGS